jgi:lipopolysaccharide export system permease protein
MDLYRTIQIFQKRGMDTGKLWMLLHLRISVPWACLILGIVGASLGSRPQRSGSSVGLGLSVIIVFVYYVIMSFSKSLGEAQYLPPLIAAWIANAVFLTVGLILCKRANRLG